MKRFFLATAVVPMSAVMALAQNPDDTKARAADKMKEEIRVELDRALVGAKVMGFSAAMGQTVKGAPYSATEINETTQVLADGTRIHNEQQTQVYRDSEGRVRRETPENISIWDPVAGTTVFLNTKNQTGQKAAMVKTFAMSTAQGRVELRSSNIQTRELPPAEITNRVFVYRGEGPEAGGNVAIAGPAAGTLRVRPAAPGKSESLGQQMISGIPAEGTRTTSTIAAGEIGNDRAIQMITERWYSQELQTVVMTKRSDPRTGEETFRLTNISRNEPPAYLFQPPAGYEVQEQKLRKE